MLLLFGLVVTAGVWCNIDAAQSLRVGHIFGNHMVLQGFPNRAVIWGYAGAVGDVVNVSLFHHLVANTTAVPRSDGGPGAVWTAVLPAQKQHGPFVVNIHSKNESVALYDVMFGDVWVCSGQSNMAFTMSHVFNHSAEIHEAMNHTNIRLLHITGQPSNISQTDININHWQVPKQDTTTSYFSAVCLLFAIELSSHINRPIGLVEGSVGGTVVEAWSSSDAIAKCPRSYNNTRANKYNKDSVLWNTLIYPMTKMTIYGAIWYQGEANGRWSDEYTCQFPAMIDDWRLQFHAGSQNQTNSMFPFGFVQLAANRNVTDSVNFAPLRWAQTARFGYAPNARMPNTFMAAAMDLPDFDSPHGTIHPRDKQDVARRLALAARGVAYHEANINFQGPFPSKYSLSGGELTIEFDHGNSAIDVKNTGGFDVCCRHATEVCLNYMWLNTQIVHHDDTSVSINATLCHGYRSHLAAVRYAWHESPCQFKQCSIYGRDNELPAPLFMKNAPFS